MHTQLGVTISHTLLLTTGSARWPSFSLFFAASFSAVAVASGEASVLSPSTSSENTRSSFLASNRRPRMDVENEDLLVKMENEAVRGLLRRSTALRPLTSKP